MNPADTAFVLVSAALVMLMTPGLALFYGGMVRSKNILATLMENFILLGVVGVIWALWGYSLAFGPDVGSFIGNLDYLGLMGVGTEPFKTYSETIPHQTFMIYQAMFAIITPALITGAFAERMKFSAFLVFMVLWVTLVYCPVAHWVWGDGGWLKGLGALDFAGGTVVHINAGIAALAAALVVGKRQGYGNHTTFIPHNLPMTVLGAGLLWFGWFGFNAGSALAADGVAVNALLTTNSSAAMAGLVWMLLSWLDGRPSTLGIATGMVVGLAAVTPACGFVTPLAAMVIGAVSAPLAYYAMRFRERRRLDESLDVWACHGMGSTWGTIATGLFATVAVNADGANGLFFGNPAQMGIQITAVIVTIVFSFGMTYGLAKALNMSIGLRVSPIEEDVGLDISSHGERSY